MQQRWFVVHHEKKKQKKQNKMDASFEKELCEEVRRYPQLYDSSKYRGYQTTSNAWREIAQTLGRSELACRQKWKCLRDRYVKAKKKLKGGSCKAGRSATAYIISMLDWLSGFINPRSTEATRTVNCSMPESMQCAPPIKARSSPCNAQNPHLPLSSVRLLVPPLRLMSACMWQVAQERNVDQYDKLAEFIMLVTEMVPELLNYKQKTQLILGLRARLILELLKTMDEVDCKAIQDHLNTFQQTTTNLMHEEDPDGEVETSKSAFVELVQTLLEDQSKKENFFKEVFSVQYGACFDTTLQILMWEFFQRLEEFLPVPRFSQVCSMFDISSLDEEFEQFLSDPEDLKRLLQHQQERQKLTKSEFTFTSDTILSTLASKQTSAASEDQDQIMDQGEGKQGTGKSQGRNQEKSEQTTVKQENSWRAEDICEDDEETDNSSIEPNCGLPEYGLSPLTSSPRSEEAAEPGDGETAVEVDKVKERLDLRRNKKSSEESRIQSLTGGRASVSLSFSEDSVRANDVNTLECGKTLASPSTLKQHPLVHTSARPFKCTQCNKTYKKRYHLKDHLLTHSKSTVRSFACSLCEKRFSSQSSLKAHLRRHSGERPFACLYCDKRFLTKSVLKYHVRIHTGERPYACTFCEKRFSSQTLLKIHLRRHSGERPFGCSYCDKRFLTWSVLKAHVRIHTGERPYACTFCEKRFNQPYMLTVHIRIHKKEKPYLCSTCGMSFRSSGALLVHTRMHTGERPSQCDICGKGFTTAIHLTQHRRTHTGEKPYSCSQCDKSFRCQSGLRRHMRTHTGYKPYQCLTCHKTFSQKSNMRVHLKVHKNI
ncbi:zinc finger protein 250-like isoform X3 [Sander lucioperca]|uniref:zinc finger protein 250-like isoform X3 n=1 Tax=Sander lucioperca TaxID=283035 RepID=UPI0016536C59|nr:zinc finger protein 250-like isoform X3 [Sander lucioperca]